MQASEALGIAAQVAVALAGFAGVVVVFRPQALHEWSPLDRVRLQLLLTNSAVPLCLSMAAMLLLSVEPPIPSIWRWCSGGAFVVQIVLVVATRSTAIRTAVARLDGRSKLMFYGIGALATAATALQAINFSVWNRFWPFFTIVFVQLVSAVVQFVRMVLLPPH